jgi:hypothetical protein
MSFCPKCGRQRSTNTRFCGGCGKDFGQPTASGITSTADEPAEPATLNQAEQTRWDAPAEQTRLDSPSDQASGQWNAADTVYAEPARATGYPPPSQPAPAYPPPAPVTPGRRPGGRGTAILVIVVIVVALGAGGGAYALARPHGGAKAQPPGRLSVTAPPATTAPAVQAPAVQAPASAVVNASASPTTSPPVSVTPTPTRTGTVQVAPGVAGDPAEPQVEAYLNRYFSAINTRNYGAYQSLLDAQEQQGNSRSTFDNGFATTKDSDEVLTGVEDTGGGTLTANVSFTSRQSPGDSVDESACDNWQISLYLVAQGNSYVMTAAPAGYHAGYTDC